MKHHVHSQLIISVAQSKSIYADPAQQIQELTAVINEDIKQLNGQISALQEQQKAIGRSRHAQKHSATVVEALKTQLHGTTKDFSVVLEIRSEVTTNIGILTVVLQNIKSQQRERELFMGGHSSFTRRSGTCSECVTDQGKWNLLCTHLTMNQMEHKMVK